MGSQSGRGHDLRKRAVRALGGPARVEAAQLIPRRATSALRPLPDFMIIGAQKCGTTTLYDYLARHPDIRPARKKELHFFDNSYARGERWYRSNFPPHYPTPRPRRWATGEASPYYLLHPLAPARARQMLPSARIIAVLRHPVDRAYSHYQHERAKGRESLAFAEAIAAEPARTAQAWAAVSTGASEREDALQSFSYLSRGRYAEQLERWLEHFPRAQVLVLKSEDLFARPAETMAEAFAFLGLPEHRVSYTRLNARSYAPLDAALRGRLTDYYRQPVADLQALLDRDFGWTF